MATTTQKTTAGGLAALLIALLLGYAAVSNPSPPPTTSAPPTTARATTTPPRSLPATRRYFADSASWNQPAATFGESTTLAPYALRWWNYAGGGGTPGDVDVAFDAYSIPIYQATASTTTARVYQTNATSMLYPFGVPAGTAVPWNPTWKAGSENDAILAVVDGDHVWEIAGVGQLAVNCLNPGNLIVAGQHPNDVALCVFDTRTYSNLSTATDGTTTDGRGMGINKLALLTRADEVRTGTIRHALEMTITATMFGQPACVPLKGPDAPGFGVDCGGYLAPATKLERTLPDTGGCPPQAVTPAARAQTIPEGMRFAIKVTDSEIDAWLDSRHYTGPLRSTAKTFAVALRDYGWIIGESGCFGSHIETDGIVGPSGATWAALGVAADGTHWPTANLLDGLITPSRLYVVTPPK